MKKASLFAILVGFNIVLGACSDDENTPITNNEPFQLPEKAYVLAEQTRRAVVIRDAETQQNVWSWDPYTARVPSAHQDWFINPSEVKPVFNKRYILMTASGGAVALIRLSDHKLMFYANCGQNPHSAEILPDGNIVTAESKSGEINTFVVDTVKVLGTKANTVKLGNAHNVVWDKKREYIYATATIQAGVTALFRFKYNNDNPTSPKLTNQSRIYTFEKESGGHDLFPVYGENDKLWFTATSAVYKFDVSTDTPSCEKVYDMADIKSVCNGPDGILLLKPTEEWWAEGLMNEKGEALFKMDMARIYKGRWMMNNTFSYPEKHDLVLNENE
ncbi:DUF6528 family protein [Bacteroides sp. OttesenSCG-928-M17]|nr:DUF6528 family protein [Bacteroides sp. OttesenSCG-928-M17]